MFLPSYQEAQPMRSQSVDDYLKALYKLETEEKAVSTTALARHMDVTAASATGMIQRLARDKLVDYRRYYGVRLSAEGRQIALRVIRNHRIIEIYLVEELGLPWDKVHAEAEQWEHVVSTEVVERMAERLGNPKRDPHGQPIPDRGGTMPERRDHVLADAPVGALLRVTEVDDEDGEVLRHLETMGLGPDSRLEIAERRPYDNLLMVRVGGKTEVVGPNLAQRIRVARLPVVRRSRRRSA